MTTKKRNSKRIFLLKHDSNTIDVMLKDGSLASIFREGNKFVANLYQSRFSANTLREQELWDIAQEESKMYTHEWPENRTHINYDMISDCVLWLDSSIDIKRAKRTYVSDSHEMADIMDNRKHNRLWSNIEYVIR